MWHGKKAFDVLSDGDSVAQHRWLRGIGRASGKGILMLKYDANDVVMFVAAAEAGTLSGAAKELGVPTSTVSRSLTRLEQRLQMVK